MARQAEGSIAGDGRRAAGDLETASRERRAEKGEPNTAGRKLRVEKRRGLSSRGVERKRDDEGSAVATGERSGSKRAELAAFLSPATKLLCMSTRRAVTVFVNRAGEPVTMDDGPPK